MKHNYITSIYKDYLSDERMAQIVSGENYVRNLLQFEVALAKAQAEINIIPKSAAEEIENVIAEIQIAPESLAGGSLQNGIPTIALLKTVKSKLSEEASSYLHFGATSQDVMDTAYVLMVQESLDYLEVQLKALIKAFGKQLEQNKDVVSIGRTRSQQAVPLTLGIKISNWLNPLLDKLAALDNLRAQVLTIQLGGAVGSLSAIDADSDALLEHLANTLGLNKSFPWHNDGSKVALFTNWVTTVSASVAKIAKDILTFSQTEIGEVIENKNGGGKSSTMPHKNNPILSEAIVALAQQNIHLNAASQISIINMNERDAVAWIAEWLSLPDLLTNTAAILKHAITIGENMEFQLAAVERNLQLTNGLVYSEAASFELAKHFGREIAKSKVTAACALAVADKITLAAALEQTVEQNINWSAVFEAATQKGIGQQLVAATLNRIEAL